MRNLICLFVILSFPAYSVDKQTFKDLITRHIKGQQGKKIEIAKQDPLYPAYIASKLLGKESNLKRKDLIKELEELLTLKDFKGKVESKSFEIGTIGSHSLWRNVIYLMLGRAYYEEGEFDKAVLYLGGVKEKSPLGLLASLEKSWAYLQLNDIEKASNSHQAIEGFNLSQKHQLYFELKVQEMYILVRQRKFTQALEVGKTLKKESNPVLIGLFHKVQAQAYFSQYLEKGNDMKFQEKLDILQEIAIHAEKVPVKERDAEFSFLASEAYWHTASAYRVNDPLKHKKQVSNFLKVANNWIAPWIDRSIEKKRAFISEEAFFFGIALQWERESYSDAKKRLFALPKLFPQGEYLEDAYQLMGDYYFDKKQFKNAIVFYRKLTNLAEPQKAAYGVYKAAWSFYNLNEKWKALRHFERLMVFYQDMEREGKKFLESEDTGLVKESKRDFITIMAELLGYKEAFAELKIFNFKPDEELEYKIKLAKNYQAIGRFTEAIKSYNFLLNNHLVHEKTLEWLNELLQTHLSNGTRLAIAKDFEKFYPKILALDKFSKDDLGEFEKKLVGVILTSHREARKTDDKRIWKAVDALYVSFMKFFKNSQVGDIWYFGAQRQERLKKRWGAIAWYQNAGAIKGYTNSRDAAFSVLRVLKSVSDDLSLKKKVTPDIAESYQKMAKEAQWFFSNYPKEKEAELSKYLHIEGLFKGGKYENGNEFVLKEFSQIGDNKDTWKLYLAQNKWFYDKKSWTGAKDLAKDILNKEFKHDKDHKTFLENVYQETNFLLAFESSQRYKKSEKKNGEELKKSRLFYRAAISAQGDDEKQLKAWYNYLTGYELKSEEKEFLENIAEFDKYYSSKKKTKQLYQKFFFDIYAFAAKNFGESDNFYQKAVFLEKSAFASTNNSQKKDLLWEALTIFASYEDKENFIRIYNWLEKKSPEHFDSAEKYFSVARGFFHLDEKRKAFLLTQKGFKQKGAKGLGYLLISDLFYQSFGKDNKLHESMVKYLDRGRGELAKTPILSEIYGFLEFPKWQLRQAEIDSLITNSKPTSLKIKDVIDWYNQKNPKKAIKKISKSDLEVNRLKIILSDVGTFLNQMTKAKNIIAKVATNSYPLMAKTSICYAPNVTSSYIEKLEAYQSVDVKNKQWKPFLEKLRGRIEGLSKTRSEEERACLDMKKTFAKLGPPNLGRSYFCIYSDCEKKAEDKATEIASIEASGSDAFSKIWRLVQKGYYARAELIADRVKNKEVKSLALGILRWSANDSWNSWDLLKVAQKVKKFSPVSHLFMGIIALENESFQESAYHLKAVKAKSLPNYFHTPYRNAVNRLNDSMGKKRSIASEKKS